LAPSTPRFSKAAVIRFSHCDPAGIVFFPQYLVMFNDLVEDWFTHGLGVCYAEFFGVRRLGFPTVSLACDFKAVSRIGDEVTLSIGVDRVGTSSIALSLHCNAGEERRVEARQVLVATSLETHRPIPLPPDIRQALDTFTHVQTQTH
jgi:4-hydroxybenzoyl-CoA thioesterase